jgi:gliding motility-associated lipoprotein GldH
MYCSTHLSYFCKKKLVNKYSHFFVLKYFRVALLALIVCCLSSCAKLDVYEKNISIPKYEWAYSLQPTFDFDITDTASLYNVFIVLRHTDAYRYNNIWLNAGSKAPGDSSMRYQRLDLQLGSDAKGWEGTGMDDIWELRKPITNGPVKFKKAGAYSFSLAQVMRESPLQHIMSVGVRVEKIK